MIELDKVYLKNKDKTISYIFSKINNIEISKEMYNDIFYKIHKNINSFDENRNFLVWFYEITNNTIIDFLRKRKPNIIEINNDLIPDDYINFENKIELNDINNKIKIAIDNISNINMKKIAKLHFINELTYEEVSQALNIPLGSVKGNIHRIKEFVKEFLNKNYKIKNNYLSL